MAKKFTPFIMVFLPILAVVGLMNFNNVFSSPTEATELDDKLEAYNPVSQAPVLRARQVVGFNDQGELEIASQPLTFEQAPIVNEPLNEAVFLEEEPIPFTAGISHNDLPFETYEPLEQLQLEDEPFFLLYFQDWANSSITTRELDEIALEGHIPIVSWEPHDFDTSFETEIYSLDDIANGVYDDLIVDDLKSMGEHDGIVYLRFAHEFNGNWYPWSVTVNDNTPEQYVAAWRHLVDLAEAQDATNIRWIWSPNTTNFLEKDVLNESYPGDDYVDIVGIVGYLDSGFNSLDLRFEETISEIRTFSDKPIVITETGAAPDIENRNSVICQYIQDLKASEDIVGFVWFDKNARDDWRIADGVEAFKTGLSDTGCTGF